MAECVYFLLKDIVSLCVSIDKFKDNKTSKNCFLCNLII